MSKWNVKQMIIALFLVGGILGGVGLPSGASAAISGDVYAGGRYAGYATCGAYVRASGNTTYPYRHYVWCEMTDTRADGKGIYASMRIQSSGAWVLSASQCRNLSGAGTTTSCQSSFLSRYTSVQGEMRWGYTDNGSYYQTGLRTSSM